MKKEYEEKKKVFIERLNKEHQERLRKQKETDKDHQENKEGKEQGEEKKLAHDTQNETQTKFSPPWRRSMEEKKKFSTTVMCL